MNIRPGHILLTPLAAVLLAAAAACGQTTSDPPAPTPRPAEPSIATAVPLSKSERAVVEDFSEQSRSLEGEWNKFREEFDDWRAGLIDCHPSSVQDALKSFAVEFKAITDQAIDLPRAPLTKDLADSLISAAAAEEAAFRELRDRWQPNAVSLFEAVEMRRTEAGSAQKSAQDAVVSLQREFEEEEEEDQPEGETFEEDFLQSLESVIEDWDGLHEEYYDLLVHLSVLDVPDILTRLGVLGERLVEIAAVLRDLPATGEKESVAEALSEAAEAELSALRHLITLLASVDGPADSAPSDVESPPPDIVSLFSEMNAQVKDVEDELNDARKLTPRDIEGDPEQNLADLADYLEGHLALVAEWEAFHKRYDGWRSTEGGCDRTEVAQELARFNVEVGRLAQEVRDLPHLSHLLPIYDALVDAAEREEGAVRSLTNSWQPFTVDAFKALDTERVTVDRLRRQAAIGLKELEDRFSVSSGGP